MEMKDICPCVNLTCPNHGLCEKCTSRHLKKGSLNFCGFNTILPVLREAIDLSPESPTAKKLTSLVENTLKAHEGLMEKHQISENDKQGRLKQVSDFSDY